jgi:hypothetical protein
MYAFYGVSLYICARSRPGAHAIQIPLTFKY